jgi:hypothetical protein
LNSGTALTVSCNIRLAAELLQDLTLPAVGAADIKRLSRFPEVIFCCGQNRRAHSLIRVLQQFGVACGMSFLHLTPEKSVSYRRFSGRFQHKRTCSGQKLLDQGRFTYQFSPKLA